jgi:hypothetical protein
MDILELAGKLVGQPLSLLLLAALILVFGLRERDRKKYDEDREAWQVELKTAYDRSEERDAQYTSLVRESVVALTRVADVLR